MIDYLSSPVVHEAFFKKYASKKFLKGKGYYALLIRPPLTRCSIHCSSQVGQGIRCCLW